MTGAPVPGWGEQRWSRSLPVRRPSLSALVAVLAAVTALAPTAPPAPTVLAAQGVSPPSAPPASRSRTRGLDHLTAAELEDDLGQPFHGAVGRRATRSLHR